MKTTINIKKGIFRFLTLGIKIGIVGASSTQEIKTQRRVSASTFEMKTVAWLAGAYRCYTTNNNTNNQNISNVTPVACYPNADTLKSVILKENKNKIGIYLTPEGYG